MRIQTVIFLESWFQTMVLIPNNSIDTSDSEFVWLHRKWKIQDTIRIQTVIFLESWFQTIALKDSNSPVGNLGWEGSDKTCSKHHQRHSSNHGGVLFVFFVNINSLSEYSLFWGHDCCPVVGQVSCFPTPHFLNCVIFLAIHLLPRS